MPHSWRHSRSDWVGSEHHLIHTHLIEMWCLCALQGSWDRWHLRVPSNSNASMILWPFGILMDSMALGTHGHVDPTSSPAQRYTGWPHLLTTAAIGEIHRLYSLLSITLLCCGQTEISLSILYFPTCSFDKQSLISPPLNLLSDTHIAMVCRNLFELHTNAYPSLNSNFQAVNPTCLQGWAD